MELTRAARNASVSRLNDAGVPVRFEVCFSTTDFTKKKKKKKQVVKVAVNIVMKLKIPPSVARISLPRPDMQQYRSSVLISCCCTFNSLPHDDDDDSMMMTSILLDGAYYSDR